MQRMPILVDIDVCESLKVTQKVNQSCHLISITKGKYVSLK